MTFFPSQYKRCKDDYAVGVALYLFEREREREERFSDIYESMISLHMLPTVDEAPNKFESHAPTTIQL